MTRVTTVRGRAQRFVRRWNRERYANADFIVLLSIGAVMIWKNWRLALATFAVLPLIMISTWIFRDRVRDANRRIRTAIARINSFLQEHLSGMSIVQIFNRERKSREQFAELNRIHMEAYKDAITAFAVFFPAVELFSTTAIAIVFWYGGLLSFAGAVTVGVLITFMQYAQRFFRPIQDLSEKFNILQSAMAACERIFKLLDELSAYAAVAEAPWSFPIRAATLNFATYGSPTRAARVQRKRTGYCATSPFTSLRDKPWPSWATLEREKPR